MVDAVEETLETQNGYPNCISINYDMKNKEHDFHDFERWRYGEEKSVLSNGKSLPELLRLRHGSGCVFFFISYCKCK